MSIRTYVIALALSLLAFACGDNLEGTGTGVVSLAVTPASPMVEVGGEVQLAATATSADGTTRDVTAEAAWSSSEPTVASVDASGRVTGVASGSTRITAAFDGKTASTTVTVGTTTAELVAIEVTPTEPAIARGTTLQLTATGRYADNTTMDLTSQVTWSSDDTASVTVDATGLVTGAAAGDAVVTATLGQLSGMTTVSVTNAALVEIQLTPANPSLAAGTTQQMTATGVYTDQTTQDLTDQVVWASTMESVATVSQTGLVTGVAPGTTTIRANVGAIAGTTTLTVTNATLVSLQITPANPSLPLGTDEQLTATGTFSDNSTQDLTTSVTWSSSAPTVATVSDTAPTKGFVETVGVGTATITATSGAVSATTVVTVTDAVLASITVTPVNPSVVLGTDPQFTATGTYSDNTTADITNQVTWTSSMEAVATVSNAAGAQGRATTRSEGMTTITATLGTITGSTNLEVTAATLVSIAVTPANESIADGRTLQYTATGTYSNGDIQNITTEVTWMSSNDAVATISNVAADKGLATAQSAGTTQISATLGTVTGTTNLTVTNAVLLSIAVSPANSTLPRGRTRQFTATGTYSNGDTANLTEDVTWSSTMTNVAQISNADADEGLATAQNVGTTTITATLGTVSGSTSLEVTAAELVSIQVNPATATIMEEATQPFQAIGTFSDNSMQNITDSVTWASSNTAVAQISNAAGTEGRATGTGGGTTTITATSGTVVGMATLTVNGIVPTVTAITPADMATNVNANTAITVTFSRAMSLASLTVQTAAGACTGAIQVSRDNFATCIGLSAVTLSPNGQTATTTASPALAFGGVYRVRVTTAATSSTGTALAADVTQPNGFTVAPGAQCATGLVISQVYGGGGNTGAQFNNDFIELHNPTAAPISVDGWAVQYNSATGAAAWQVTALPNVSIPAGGYFLVQQAAGTGTPGPLPTPDATGTITMAGGAGKVALTSSTVPLAGACPTLNVVDLVGYGPNATCSEAAPTASLSNSTSAQRRNEGCADANNNATDFVVAAPMPRNSMTAASQCACTVNETGRPDEADYCNLQFPTTVSTMTGATTPLIFGRIYEAGMTEAPMANPMIRAQIGFGPTTANPQNQAGWTWFDASFNMQFNNDDEYGTSFTAPAVGTYNYTSRFSLDGRNWTYCDLDGAGSNPGLTFDPARLPTMTVTQ